MARKVLLSAAVAAMMALAGCASPPRNFDFLRPGTPIDSVRSQIGLPLEKIIDLPNGNKMWSFGAVGYDTVPVTSQTLGGGFGPYGMVDPFGGMSTTMVPVRSACTVQVETNPQGRIVSWQRFGRDCR